MSTRLEELKAPAKQISSTHPQTYFYQKPYSQKIDTIINTVTQYFNLKPNSLKSSNRAPSIALPRQIAIYLIRKQTEMSHKEIATIFGKKDHTTILHACKKIAEQIETHPQTKTMVEEIETTLKSA